MRWILAVAAVISIGNAHADWSNPELDARNVSKAQWNAIARGDFAQCQADASVASRQTVPGQATCHEGMAPYLYQQCLRVNETRGMASEQSRQDILLGCMARRGWEWAPD